MRARFKARRSKSSLPELDQETVDTLAYAMLVRGLTVDEAAREVEGQGVMYEQVLALRRATLCQDLWINAIAKYGRINLIK